jgi:hypothetical protein
VEAAVNECGAAGVDLGDKRVPGAVKRGVRAMDGRKGGMAGLGVSGQIAVTRRVDADRVAEVAPRATDVARERK